MPAQARLDRGAVLGAGLAVLLALFAVAPLAYPGFFQAHTGFLPAFDVQDLGRVGRGEGILPYLLARPLLALAGSGTGAVRAGYALALALAALAVYAWTRRWLGTRGAVLAATVYTYLPWHLNTVYVRGAYAEAWLWVLWPLLLWAADGLAGPAPAGRALAGRAALLLLGLAASFAVQPSLSLLFLPVLAAYLWLAPARRPKDRRPATPVRRRWLLVPLALLLAAAAWLVAVRWLAAGMGGAGLYPYQPFQAGGEYELGLAAMGLSIVALALARWGRPGEEGAEEGQGHSPLCADTRPLCADRPLPLWFWAAVAAVAVLLTLRPAAALWQATGLPALLAEPAQMLALAGLPLAFLAGAVPRLDERVAEWSLWAALLALVVLEGAPRLTPRFTQVAPGSRPLAVWALPGPDLADEAQPTIVLLDQETAWSSEVTPTLTLTLTWQAVAPVADDLTVFVHLLDAGGEKVSQRDTRPCAGECPTDAWQPGEIVVDSYQLDPPALAGAAPAGTAPAGPYRLALGLYRLDTGERAAVAGRDDGTVVLDVPQ